MFSISDDFVKAVIAMHGPDGRTWLDQLPALLQDCVQRWDLTLLPPFAYGSIHYVAPVVRADGMPAVIKVHSPTNEFRQEAEALRIFNGHGAVRVLACELDRQALLLERLQPGIPLSAVQDAEKATMCAAAVMRQLWQTVPDKHPFPTVSDWGQGFTRLRQRFAGGSGPFPAALVARAEALFGELSASMAAPVVLHGDLHYENILAAEREPWLAIDPKGLVGEPAYEPGALLRNEPGLYTSTQPAHILARRIDQLAAELDLDRRRIRDWGLTQAVLAAWWSFEDHGDINAGFLTCAQLLADMQH